MPFRETFKFVGQVVIRLYATFRFETLVSGLWEAILGPNKLPWVLRFSQLLIMQNLNRRYPMKGLPLPVRVTPLAGNAYRGIPTPPRNGPPKPDLPQVGISGFNTDVEYRTDSYIDIDPIWGSLIHVAVGCSTSRDE